MVIRTSGTKGHRRSISQFDVVRAGLPRQAGGLEPPAIVRLEFSLPGATGRIGPQAQVMRTDSADRMAVAFTEVEREDEGKIQDYVVKAVKV